MPDNFRPSPHSEETRKFDPYVHATTVIGEEHRMIHDGFLYFVNAFETVPDATTERYLIRTGTKPVHFKRLVIAASEGPLNFELRELATVTALGTEIPNFNANRLSPNVSECKVYDETTTFSDNGSPILGNLYIPGADPRSGVVGETGGLEEIILLPNTDYQLAMENTPAGAGNTDIVMVLVWYEIDYGT